MKKPFSTPLSKLLFAFAALPVATPIAEAAYYPDFRKPFDFSLVLANNSIDLQTGNNKHRVSLDRISIEIFTLIEPRIQFGFISGSSNLSLDNDPVSTGKSLNGYHAGLAIRSILGRNPQIGFHANYIYQETKNETTRQTTTLDWHEWTAGTFGKITLDQQLELSVGWAYHDVDARRRAAGSSNQTQNLKLATGSQGRLEIAWLDHSNGRVGLAVQRGRYQQVEFRFSRKFR
ncbi:MAG: hypothetical protein GXP18_06895 [Gammaproteobacteria bacterium]|nr:hypothetical protein [Gammaproteobacteria bacterium]